MSTTSPIRKEEDLQRFRNYYLEKGKMRNYLLIVVGLNTALRIGDVLSLQWKDVYDYKRRRFRAHLQVVEQKTGKTNQIALNDCVLHALRQCYNGQKADEYLFYSACHKNQPISRSQAWRIVRQAACLCRRSRSFILDDSCSILRNGNKIFRRSSCSEIPCGSRRRSQPWRSFLLY